MSKAGGSGIKYSRINAQAASPSNDNGILEEFRLEFLECWEKLPNKAFFFILLGIWLVLFQFLGNSTLGFVHSPSLLYWMYLVYQPNEQGGDDAHAFIIPFVVLGILWWRRKELVSLPLRTWSPGLAILVFALFLHFLGYRVQQPRISIVALFTGIYGLSGMAWGPDWLRKTFFPFILFAFCIPLGTLTQGITFPLRLMVTKIVEGIAQNICLIDVLRDGTTLRDPTGRYQYEVAAACSGMRSLIATIVLAIVLGMVSLKAWWRRGVLFASAIPLAVIGNVLRMLTIIIVAAIGGQEAGKSVHDSGFWSLVPYIPPFFGLIWLAQRLREPGSADPPASSKESRIRVSPAAVVESPTA